MQASEARELTARYLQKDGIKPLLKIAYQRIKEFAEKGKSSVPYPFHGMNICPSKELIEAAIQRLRNDDYKAVHYDNPDPGDQRSCSYWEISW